MLRFVVPYQIPQQRFETDETADHYVMSFDVPGIHRDDLNVELTGRRLVVSGERKGRGRFEEAFTLPEGVSAEGIVAEHKDGVLRLAIQKPASARATRITIMDGAAQQREGGFFKNLVAQKKPKEPVTINGATAKNEAVAMAN